MTDEAFDTILQFVEDELSFATSHYNNSYLDRRISSRMRRTNSESYAEYAALLRSDTDEQAAMLDSLSINVTGFFRNPDVWNGIRDVLLELAEREETIHVWSAACADGREPYSVAMLAQAEPALSETSIYVLGTDISEAALETARSGVYEQSRTTDIRQQLEFLGSYDEYVETDENVFRVTDEIKRRVSFERHDLINDEPKSGFDLVICRNLFIYIDNEYKEPILNTIANSLRPDGYLVIGKAETIPPQLKSAFEVHDGRLRIYRCESPESTQQL